MIILGYAGIGKTTLGGQDKFIDLDYLDFINNQGDLNITQYLNIAISLHKQGYNVLIFAHPDIVTVFNINKISDSDYLIVYPSLSLKDNWLEQLQLRAKDFMIWPAPVTINYNLIKDTFERDINKIQQLRINKLEISDMNYNLKAMLTK